MHRVFRFKHHLRVEAAGAEQVFLLGEREHFLLRGRVYALLAPLIDGRRSVAEILAALEGQAAATEVYYAVTRLEEQGYVAEVAAGAAPEVAGFWEALGLDAAQAADQLAQTSVVVRAIGGEDPAALVAALEAAGIAVRPEGAVTVVWTADYLAPEVAAWSLEAPPGARWMPLKTAGIESWIGPVLGAAGAPCWACLALRLRENRPVEAYLQQRRGNAEPLSPPRVGLGAGFRAGLDVAAVALARWIVAGGRGALDDHVLSFDAAEVRSARHLVVRRPQCAVCGDPELLKKRALVPVTLVSRPKQFTSDGGHRCLSPEETLARHEHHVSAVTGVVSELRSVGGDHPLRQIYSAIFRVTPLAPSASFRDFHRIGSGKGRTAVQARAGALCESIERFSAIFRGDERRERARLSELGPDALHPNEVMHFSEAQLRKLRKLGPQELPQRTVPLPYENDAVIDWTPVWSLTGGRRRWVPTAYCYLHVPTPPEEQFCHFNSNGNASGNCLEEAILQGFFELCERDAVAVWWYHRLSRPGVDLASFDEPYFLALEARYRALGFEIRLLDLTHDLEIPTFAAVALETATGRLWAGCGCHFDAKLAVSRALTEVNQCVRPHDLAASPWTVAKLGEPAFWRPDAGARPRRREDYPDVSRDDLRDDVQTCVDRAARVGLETLVLDQTRPEIGLSAVKVIVPGLRHFWPRLGPGRLYEVPVRMGWLAAPLEEAQLNPTLFFF